MSQKYPKIKCTTFLPHAEPTLKKLNCVICEVVFFSQSRFRNYRNPFFNPGFKPSVGIWSSDSKSSLDKRYTLLTLETIKGIGIGLFTVLDLYDWIRMFWADHINDEITIGKHICTQLYLNINLIKNQFITLWKSFKKLSCVTLKKWRNTHWNFRCFFMLKITEKKLWTKEVTKGYFFDHVTPPWLWLLPSGLDWGWETT